MADPTGPNTKAKLGFMGFMRILGPGVVTGAADDDPSGIATYSQTGAQFGFSQLWTAFWLIPLLLAVQEACARIGTVTGKGLAGVIKEHYSRTVLVGVVVLVLVANTINVGADIGAVAAAGRLVVNIPFAALAIATAVLAAILPVVLNYRRYAQYLKWMTLSLLAYPATALIVKEPWLQILYTSFVPHLEFTFAFLFIITGVFGTTISPYMFFWQASQEIEEEIKAGVVTKRNGTPKLPRYFIRNMRIDTTVGMLAAEIAQWFIIMTTATVLFSHGVTNIATAADAAKALEPLVHSFPNSGQLAKDLFAIGVVGVGMLAIPVLAGSSSYALCEAMNWKEGLSNKFGDARLFYGVMIVSTAIGLVFNFVGIDPIKALVFTAVFNGIAAVPLLVMIGLINGNKKVLGERRGRWLSQTGIWVTVVVMGLAAVGLLYTTIMPH